MTRTFPIVALLLVAGCARHDGRPWFTRPSPDVERGIAALARRDPARALASFDRAAAAHPSAPEVALDRGLALLASGEHERAREAFVRATGEGASAELRAEALYDLGLSHHLEADAKAGAGEHEEAQQSFRDAVEAYKRSLRTRPAQTIVAWNLEIALRRMHEEEETNREQQEQEQQQRDQNQQNQDPQASQDPQSQDPQQQDPQSQDPQNQGQPQDQQGQQASQDPQSQDPQQQDPQSQGQPERPRPEPGERPAEPREGRGASADQADSLPPEMRAMLDALDRGEGSLEAERAQARAQRENRRPTQDW